MIITGPTGCLSGHFINFECYNRDDLIRNCAIFNSFAPYSQLLAKVFKKDALLECIVEQLFDTVLYYIYSEDGRGDELYYFQTKNRFFHGEVVWSRYHPFVAYLQEIQPTEYIADDTWFVGSRNNYTHQVVDLLPSILVQKEISSVVDLASITTVYGRSNIMIDSFLNLNSMSDFASQKKFYLDTLQVAKKVNGWNIKCVRLRSLKLVKHLSIFKCYDLLRNILIREDCGSVLANQRIFKTIGYLARLDSRIKNQDHLIAYLVARWNAVIVPNMSNLTFDEKQQALKEIDILILPPGSENINAFLLASNKTQFIQLIPGSVREMIRNPFKSFAGLRYQLPLMNRLIHIPCECDSSGDPNSIECNLTMIESELCKIMPR